MKKLVYVLMAVALGLSASRVQAGIIYVQRNAAGPGDGLSWATAFTNVQAAVNAALPGDQVWVAAGLYQEGITLKDGVQLYGAFTGNETDLSQRNWKTNASILEPGTPPNYYTEPIITIIGAGAATRVDGFAIRNGRGTHGGGISCLGASPTLVNNLITNCSVGSFGFGGGIYCSNASPVVSNNVIVDNKALGVLSGSGGGGGMYCEVNSNPFIANNIFKANGGMKSPSGLAHSSPGGGAIFSTNSSPQIINNLFEGNVSTNIVFSNQGLGGAIYAVGGVPRIVNNTFVRNWTVSWPSLGSIATDATDSGGAVYCDSASALIANNLVAFNTSGMKFGNNVPQLRNNCTYGNSFFDYQGANPTGANGNISVEPKLTGPYADVHLTANSPCRGAGDASLVQTNWLDIDGRERMTAGTIDIGADQYDGTSYNIPEKVIRVSPGGSDANDGSSWSKAMESINGAITRAMVEGGEIWVAAGDVKSTFPVDSMVIPTFVYVFGGFAGNETNRSQRDWIRNSTVVGKSSGARMQMIGFGEYSALSGFILENGRYGAVSCLAPFSGLIANNRFVNNRSTFNNVAAIYVAGNAQIVNNVIASNSVTSWISMVGAGIYCAPGATPLIANNTIVGNKFSGVPPGVGGIFLSNASPTIVNNIIAFNDGGNIVCGQDSSAPVLMNNCVFGGGDSNYVGVLPGLNDISMDPQMGDSTMNYALKVGSPCLDTGDGSVVQPDWVDIYGRARVQGAAVDIGAYESPATAEWLPFLYSPEVTVSTVGGISYAQYSTVLTNDGFRVVSISPVTQTGANFSRNFRFEWFTGPTSPASNVVSGTSVLGALQGGNYSFTRSSWGGAQATIGFSVPTNAAPTLTSASANGSGLQMNVAGVPGVNYVVLTSTNLVDWSSIYTNHGGPFVFADSTNTNSSQRFYRVQIVQ